MFNEGQCVYEYDPDQGVWDLTEVCTDDARKCPHTQGSPFAADTMPLGDGDVLTFEKAEVSYPTKHDRGQGGGGRVERRAGIDTSSDPGLIRLEPDEAGRLGVAIDC